MKKPDLEVKPESYRLSEAKGLGTVALLFFLVLWIITATGVSLFLRWSIEQTMFDSDFGLTDGRWLVNLLSGIFLFFPIMALYFTINTPRIRLVLRLWAIASGFVLLSGPAKLLFLTAQNQTSLLLSAALLLTIGVIALLRKNRFSSTKNLPKPTLIGATVLISTALATPWILWGALGSIMDVLFTFIFAASFGFFVMQTVIPEYLDYTREAGSVYTRKEYLFDGFVFTVFLFIMVGGLSHNLTQILLVLSIPAAGWLIAALAGAARNRDNHGKYAVGLLSAALLFLPLAFFDADELALGLATSGGEVFFWSNRAGWNTLVYLLAIAVVIFFLHKHAERANVNRRVNLILVVIGVVECFGLYFIAGQPGFFGDCVFVVLDDQVNTMQVNDLPVPMERREALYQSLTQKAEVSQQGLRTTLEKWKVNYTPYYLVNGLEVNLDWPFDGLLAKAEGVNRVLESPRLRPLPQPLQPQPGEISAAPEDMTWNMKVINLDEVRQNFDVSGAGIVIGQTDSGVEGSHPEVQESYRGFGGSNDYNWFDPWNHTVSPTDLNGHGTATTSLITGMTLGIAPEAEWIGCVNLARNVGNPAFYLDCMQFMFAPYAQGGDPFVHGKPEAGAMIVNNSWGCPRVEGCDTAVFEPAVNVMESAGIFMSVAAGNTGYSGCSSINVPLSIYANVFTVGSVDEAKELSMFSSKGPVIVDGSGRVKPDLLAPGDFVLVAAPGGTYTTSSGTSLAAPHVTGVVALMWSANPNLIGDIPATNQILSESAQPYTGTLGDCGGVENEAGAGILDAFAAVKRAIEVK